VDIWVWVADGAPVMRHEVWYLVWSKSAVLNAK
jgi:hypothetical protein